MSFKPGLIIGVGLLVMAVSGTMDATARQTTQVDNWNSGMALPEARDLNPDPGIFEINLEARLAKVNIGSQVTEAWTYDGGIPGPLIRLKVGDRLIVHFTNKLPMATTVHWHGVRVPIGMDGVPGASQPAVEMGNSFTYDFIVPDAGLYWYHPHIMSAMQVGFGLYGAVLVEDPADSMAGLDELIVVLSDIDLETDGSLRPADTGGSAGMAFGREGTTVLVNGRKEPKLVARAGVPQRWRIVNTAKSRYFELDMEDESPFTKIGSDGGLLEHSVQLATLVLAPGERADVIVTPRGKPGKEITVITQLFNRGYGSVEYRLPENLFRVAIADLPEVPGQPLPKVGRHIEALSKDGATEVKLELTLKQYPGDGSFEYGINGVPYWKAAAIPAKPGETQLWTVNNTTPWSHPLHLHGFFFQVLDKNGVPVQPLEWKDTVNVPFKQSLQLLVKFDDREGHWMVHCHILDHADGGLMTTVKVGDGPDPDFSHEGHE